MKKGLGIASVESRAAFREQFVEKFVRQNLPPQTHQQNKLSGMGNFSNRYTDIECCAAELPVIGTVDISVARSYAGIRRFSVPVTARFIVFCTREAFSDYKVAWSNSLS